MIDFDVFLFTYNHLNVTKRCIDALYRNTTEFNFLLTVVDDSTDDTPEYFAQLSKEKGNIQFLHSDEHFRNMDEKYNLALKYTENPFIVFLANSVMAEPGWISYATQLIKENPRIAQVGVKSVLPGGMIENAGVFVCDNEIRCIGTGEPGHRYSFTYEIDAVGQNACIYRREAIANGFDFSEYIPYSGPTDIDHCLTLKEKGWEIWYCGNGAVYHLTKTTRGDNPNFDNDEAECRCRFAAKWNHIIRRTHEEVMANFKGFKYSEV